MDWPENTNVGKYQNRIFKKNVFKNEFYTKFVFKANFMVVWGGGLGTNFGF